MQNFGEHGLELVTVKVALRLLAMLTNPKAAAERSAARGHLADLCEISMQMLNPLLAVQNFGEHGRELVTVEVALRLLAMLADPKAAAERSAARGQPSQRLVHILRQCVFHVRPQTNA